MKHKDKMKEFQNLTTEEIKKKIKDLDKFDFEHKTDIIYFRNKIDESEGRLVIITNYNKLC